MIKPSDINVLIACEESQRVCTAFRDLGFNAYSCDLIPTSGDYPQYHIQGNATQIIKSGLWHIVIAHPPCTYLSNAGACRLYPKKGVLNVERYKKGLQAVEFFNVFVNAKIKYKAIENPIPSKIFGLPPYTQTIQPYEYGEPWSKKTCLWLYNLPPLKPTNIVDDYKPFVSCGTSKNKGNREKAGFSRAGGAAKIRSKTFTGIAKAMADQWGNFVLKELNKNNA